MCDEMRRRSARRDKREEYVREEGAGAGASSGNWATEPSWLNG